MDKTVEYIIGLTVIIVCGIACAMIPLSRVLGKMICSVKKDSKFCDPEYSERVRKIIKYTSMAVIIIGILTIYFISRT